MNQDKHSRTKQFIGSVCRRYHFATPNTYEIIFTLLMLGVVSRLLALLGRD